VPSASSATTELKLALIGASGYVGSRVLSEALRRGHEVTGIVRTAARLTPQPGLTIVSADVQDPDQVADSVAGHDAVISCFHGGGHDPEANPAIYRDIVEGTRSILEGVKRSHVNRIVYVGGCGSLRVKPGVMLIDDREFILNSIHRGRPEGTYPAPPAKPSLDIPLGARMAFYLFERERDLDWSFVSPSRFLGDFGGRSGRIVYGNDELIMIDGAPAKVDVEDLAIAVVDEVESNRHVRGHFTVASGPAPSTPAPSARA
jgi:putative NADH-flavin reductase